MSKDIASYFLEQGEPIVPKPKPKQYAKTLDILNTKAAAKTLSPKTYVNMVGEISKKALDNKEITTSDYYDIVTPLFGEAGEKVTKKIEQYDAELNKYSSGGRVNFAGGGTDYWAMVTRMFIEAGSEKGTGMNIKDFAAQYFPRDD